MNRTLFKDIFREIKGSLSKFLSIFAIVALGAGFFAGIKATGPDMKVTADKYFNDYRLMDIRLVSTVGFNDEDVAKIKEVSGAEGVYPSYSLDVLVNSKKGEMVFKVFPLPMDKLKKPDESYINRTKLVEGRYPKEPGEAVAERGKMVDLDIEIGSKVKLTSGTDEDINENLKRDEYTIVGIVETPYYLTDERGTTDIGNGKVDSFIMIPDENFKMTAYTDIFLTFNNSREIFTFDDEYDELLEPKRKKLETLGKTRSKKRYNEIVKEIREELDKNKEELKTKEKEAKEELEAAAIKIKDGEKEILKAERNLNNEEIEFKEIVKDAESKITKGEKELEEEKKKYSKNYKDFMEAKTQADIEIPKIEEEIQKREKEIVKGEKNLQEIENQLEEIEKQEEKHGHLPDEVKEEKIKLEKKYIVLKEKLEIGKKELEKGKTELELKKSQLREVEIELANGKKILDSSNEKLQLEKSNLYDAKIEAERQFTKGRRKLEDSKKELEKKKIDYERAILDVEEKLAEGRKNIEEAEEKLKDINDPKWYVIKRNQTLDFIDYEMAADRIDAIAEVFPVFFFLIAALVSFTTMTRMVDEQRIYIGTLKALGYSSISIASKYIIYASLASISGGILGVLIGFKVFPIIIFNSYRIMYIMPSIVTEFNIYYAIISIGFGVLSTTFAAWFSVYKELMETPALLMRPKVQKPGKRILFEKIKPLWSRLNFTQKVTIRNLFRYKKRLFMTILGVGGCTALMVSGFGLKDSILETPAKQYDEIYQYDMIVDFNNGEDLNIEKLIEENDEISKYMLAKEKNIKISKNDEGKDAFLIVPEESQKLEEFIILRDRKTGAILPFNDSGVILTEKMSRLLDVTIGDKIYIEDEENGVYAKITGITENYVGHYIYMTPQLYKRLYGEEVVFQKLFAKNVNTSKSFEKRLSTKLLKYPEIASVDFLSGISNDYENMIGSLDYVVIVLIISAGLLAFVVLYNLTNVNISERFREIATIKVLGFYDNEVSAYVYNENNILTIIGTAIGLIMGVFLHRYIIYTGEIDYIMFGRSIKPLSFMYSVILTIIFALLVNFVMYFKLQKIEMVESLKSVE